MRKREGREIMREEREIPGLKKEERVLIFFFFKFFLSHSATVPSYI